jgi:hypothetical protein
MLLQIRNVGNQLSKLSTSRKSKSNRNAANTDSATNSKLYAPLDKDSDQFRLLRIDGGRKNKRLRCHLILASLSDPPPYHALSYTWSDPVDGTEQVRNKKIHIDNQPFYIRKNLENALINMRSQGIRTVWVDTICIDQDDIDERGVSLQAFHFVI